MPPSYLPVLASRCPKEGQEVKRSKKGWRNGERGMEKEKQRES
jgi:hypothetical protein